MRNNGLKRDFIESAQSVRRQLLLGDCSPATIVVKVDPFLVAAYSEEQDAVLILRFKKTVVPEGFHICGPKLVTLNLDYSAKHGHVADDHSGAKLDRTLEQLPAIDWGFSQLRNSETR